MFRLFKFRKLKRSSANLYKLMMLKLAHPSAVIYVRKYPSVRDVVYYDLSKSTVWYCNAADEIIIDVNDR